MYRRIVLAALLIFGLCFIQSLSPVSGADDAKTKKSEKGDDDKDKKTPSVKSSQVRSITKVAGKITGVDDKSFNLEVKTGRTKQTLDVLIAADAKVRIPAELEFDDKGKPKKPKIDPDDTDRSLGGVKGSKDDLRDGQEVVIKVGKLGDSKQLVATAILVVKNKK